MLLFAIISLALASTTPDDPVQMRASLIAHVQRFDAQLEDLRTKINDGFMTNLDKPETGMVVESGDRDTDGLHPVLVTAVFKDGPASRAGIRTGDRIVAIGPRVLEHETTTVVEMLLEGTPGPVALTIRRGTTHIVVSVERRPLPCLRRALTAVDKHQRLDDIRVREVRAAEITRKLTGSEGTVESLTAIANEVAELWKSLDGMVEPLKTYIAAVGESAIATCQVQ